MTPERWEQIKRLFHAALAHSAEDRRAFLAQECADQSLRDEVEALIASHEQADDFIEAPASDIAAALLAEEQTGLATGQMVGPFRITNALARSGMGQVYLADDTRLGRPVALKLLPPQFTVDVDRVRRFDQEARAVSALNHPSIVTIHEIGHADSLHFIATEFVNGETLRHRLKSGRMTVGEVLDVGAQVAAALDAAHQAGIVHRDIKPENIMVRPDGVVKVLDFGLAKLMPQRLETVTADGLAEAVVQTNPGVVMGTVAYMSPEQARGQEVDARTDIWSLGVVLYEMVMGRAPFVGETPSHVIVSMLESEPSPLSSQSELPAELARIVSQTLQKQKEHRYQTASELGLDLKNLKEELTVEARLKQIASSDSDTGETSKKEERRVAFAAGNSSSQVSASRAMSSAEYLLDGIKRHRGSAVFASMGVLLLASFAYFAYFTKTTGEPIDSLAVLPFVNVSGDADAEYLADGISDRIISSLSRLPELRVVSLGTVMVYKGKEVDPQTVGRELKVRAVMIGRMIKRGDSLTISTELVDVKDNRRLWAGQYNGTPSDILTVQEEIARELGNKLRLRSSSPENQQATRPFTENSEAYDAYARGRFLLEKRGGIAYEKSVEYLEKAVQLDPNFAPAHASLSYAYWSLGNFGRRPMDEAMAQAKAAAAKALELDPTLGDAYAVLGHVASTERDWTRAESTFRRAVELNPNSAFAHSNYAFYFLAMRRFDEAVAESKRAVELEPTSVLYNRNVALNLYFARRYDETIEQAHRTLELDPNMETAAGWLANAYEQKGMYDEAVEVFFKFGEFSDFGPEAEANLKTTYATSGWRALWQSVLGILQEHIKRTKVDRPLLLADIYMRLGDNNKALMELEKASARRSWTITTLNIDPLFDNLRSDPRYTTLVRGMGLEP